MMVLFTDKAGHLHACDVCQNEYRCWFRACVAYPSRCWRHEWKLITEIT